MRRLLVTTALLVFVASCGDSYARNELELVTGFQAKAMCSCIFVMRRDEAFCRAWSKQSPAVATTSVDYGDKVVEAAALLIWGARARFVDERFGCVLE